MSGYQNVDTYDCPEPGCDFNVSAGGPQDPDEPDYFAEDIEQHKRGHECRCTFHLDMVHIDPECPQHGQAANPSTPYLTQDIPGYEWVIDADGEPIDAREVIDTDEREPIGALTGEPGTPPRGASSQAGLSAVRYARLRNPKISSGGAVTTASPAPSDDSTPSLVQLDQADAAGQRVLKAAVAWAESWGDATAPVSTPERALVDAVRDFRAVSGR